MKNFLSKIRLIMYFMIFSFIFLGCSITNNEDSLITTENNTFTEETPVSNDKELINEKDNNIETSVSDKINYIGNYYDSLGGLQKLLGEDYSSEDILLGLRALIGYSSTGSFSSDTSDKYIEKFGTEIKGTNNKHPKYGGTTNNSLADLWTQSERFENDTNPEGAFRLFYSDVYSLTLKDYDKGIIINREHVWPQSLSGKLFGTTGAGADIHHVRPVNSKLNNARGNKAYKDIPENEINLTYYTNQNTSDNFNLERRFISEEELKEKYGAELTGYANSNYFEPIDSYKGDISRIFAYLIVHYESLEDLLDNVLIGGKETLVKWNELDPVNSYEINRNNISFDYQGNRNPFIDAPDLINIVWGK